jgi:hypothetical protein
VGPITNPFALSSRIILTPMGNSLHSLQMKASFFIIPRDIAFVSWHSGQMNIDSVKGGFRRHRAKAIIAEVFLAKDFFLLAAKI